VANNKKFGGGIMNQKEKEMFEQAKTYVFNAITLGSSIQDNLIFSDRLALTEQILAERMVYGAKGFNEISDGDFLGLWFLGMLKTKRIAEQLQLKEQK
jgi:hypothetical protein